MAYRELCRMISRSRTLPYPSLYLFVGMYKTETLRGMRAEFSFK